MLLHPKYVQAAIRPGCGSSLPKSLISNVKRSVRFVNSKTLMSTHMTLFYNKTGKHYFYKTVESPDHRNLRLQGNYKPCFSNAYSSLTAIHIVSHYIAILDYQVRISSTILIYYLFFKYWELHFLCKNQFLIFREKRGVSRLCENTFQEIQIILYGALFNFLSTCSVFNNPNQQTYDLIVLY